MDVWEENEAMARDGWWRTSPPDAAPARRRPMREERWVYLKVQVIQQETKKALKVVLDDGKILWLPRSQICDANDYKAGDRDLDLAVTEWIAREKGLDE